MTNRQEVAEKLRQTGERLRGSCCSGAAVFVTVKDIISISKVINRKAFFDRLADLIDSTCHVTDEEVTHEPTLNALAVHVYGCDSCGWYFYMAEVCCHPKPFYCPMCGARVVRDEV